MNILLCSKADNGGGTWFLAQAINRYTDHRARQFRMFQTYLDYPFDRVAPSNDEMIALAEWADVLHFRETNTFMPSRYPDRPTVVTFSGRGYRRNAELLTERRRGAGWIVTVSTIDLVNYYRSDPPIWLPNCREDLRHLRRPRDGGRLRVCQAPTFRAEKAQRRLLVRLPDSLN